jgi:2-amino-4-hydroxy-6-hydroxymethyldihydropteridine diphosphokinase
MGADEPVAATPGPADADAPVAATPGPASEPAPPTRRSAPPPPPRPRNPASDLGRTTRPAYLSLGSNIEPEKNLRSALMALRARFGEVIVSPVYRMPAVGFDGPDFLNAAAIIDSDLDPFALTRWLHGIESAHGRMRSHVKNSSRTLDMDIIFFDDLVLDMPDGLQLPRPELRHAFVLKPLVDIAPGFIDPVRGMPLAEVWAGHPEREERFSTVII